jgi:hypothetical protein
LNHLTVPLTRIAELLLIFEWSERGRCVVPSP